MGRPDADAHGDTHPHGNTHHHTHSHSYDHTHGYTHAHGHRHSPTDWVDKLVARRRQRERYFRWK